MHLRARRISLTLIGGLAIFVATAALAWACFPNASISLSPSSGAARSHVTVAGSQFSSAPVTLRWGSPTGQILGTASAGGDFRVTVTIPDAAPNVYFIYAVGNQATKQAPFEVVATPTTSTPPPTGGGSSPPPSGPSTGTSAPSTSAPSTSAPSTSAPSTSAPSTGTTPQDSGSVVNSEPRPEDPRGARTVAPRGGRTDGSARRVNPRSPGSRGSSQVVRTRAGQKVFGASLAPAKSGSPAKKGSGRSAGRSQETATSKQGAKDPKRLPSLTSDSEGANDGPDRRLGIGIALLALGLVIPLAGFLVAEMRRRRAEARPGSDG